MSVSDPDVRASDDADAQDFLATLARDLATETDTERVWRRVSDAALRQVDGAEHVGIMIVTTKQVFTTAPSDELVNQADQAQYATGEGPCLTAAFERQDVVVTDDLLQDGRWPRFAQAVSPLGIRSMLSYLLYTDRQDFGALNLYSNQLAAFDEHSVTTGRLLAAHAAAAAAAADQTEHFLIALGTRDTIGQAKGILMERYKLTADQAFDLLVEASQRKNRKLHDLATELTLTGQLSGLNRGVPPMGVSDASAVIA